MKCPKCGYLGFEHADRCRNCGYEFSLAHQPPDPELPIRADEDDDDPDQTVADLSIFGVTPPDTKSPGTEPDLGRVLGAPLTAAPASGELPLFGPPIPDDEPLITKVSPPRPPLAVRRATPEVPRLRGGEPRLQSLDLGFEGFHATLEASATPAPRSHVQRWQSHHAQDEAEAEDAGVAARFVAVAIDLLILSLVDAVVIYFTMQICGLTLADLDVLPKGPLLAFLLVQNGGYLVAFTAGGQTLGKMAAGIRVVSAESETPLDLGRALVRTVTWLLLAVPIGLGFLTAVLSRDHRGLHDRLARTRVVR